jgi:hypothetical protein
MATKTATKSAPKSRISKSAILSAAAASVKSAAATQPDAVAELLAKLMTALESAKDAAATAATQPANVPTAGTTTIKSAAEIELLAQKMEASKNAGKALYKESDRTAAEIIKAVGVGGKLTLSDGRTLFVNDNYLDKAGNVKLKCAGIAMVSRFEVEIK